MRLKLADPRATCGGSGVGTQHLFSLSGRFAGVLLAIAVLSVPSHSFAQTISLGTGSYGVFEESGGTFDLSGASKITGNVELGPSATLSKDQSSSISGSTTSIAAGGSTTISSPNPISYNSGFSVSSAKTVILTGAAGVNVYNITGSMTLSGASTLEISGAANETFVFNVSNGLSFAGASSMLLKGVNASQIIFNVTGGNVAIGGASTASGTFVDQHGTETVSGASTVTGALVSGGTITVEGASTVKADPFSAPTAAAVPELPTILPAGFACVLALGAAGIKRLRRS